MATLDIPAVGYGIRYDFGIFKQTFAGGAQVERPDDWAFQGNPWEFPAPDDRWARMSLLNTARSGWFSADRTVRDYAERIWHVDPVVVSRDG